MSSTTIRRTPAGTNALTARNRMLASLPRLERERLLSRLRPVRLPRGHMLWERHQSVAQVYFLETGIVSAMVRQTAGDTTGESNGVETCVLGSEGVVGVAAILGGISPMMHVVQIPATGYMMAAEEFRQEWGRGGALQKAVMSHLRFFLSQTAQTAFCNRLHPLESRLCRWLLVVAERAETDELPLTQEFLAAMLGARRAGVTLAAGELRERGLIDYRRGRVFLRDHEGLEAASCECHRSIREEVKRLFADYESLH